MYAGFLRNAQQQYFIPLGYNEGPELNLSDPDDQRRQQALGMDLHSVSFAPSHMVPDNITVNPAAVQQLVAAFQTVAAANMTSTLFIGNGRQASKSSPESRVSLLTNHLRLRLSALIHARVHAGYAPLGCGCLPRFDSGLGQHALLRL